MPESKLRKMIAYQAARLLYERQESEYYRAKMKAARFVQKGWVKPADLPTNAEIRDQVQILARVLQGDQVDEVLLNMRIEALAMMQKLEKFHPRIIGSVLTGHIRDGSDIDLHLFSDSIESIRSELAFHSIPNELVEKRVAKAGNRKLYRHLMIDGVFPFELTVYPLSDRRTTFYSSITGKPIEKASLAEYQTFLSNQYPETDLQQRLQESEDRVDPLNYFYSLMLPLENVKQNPKYHPEGDALYHSLQVFDLACDQRPYDEEFLLAALLHDVGKGIDPFDHVDAGLEAVEEYVTERTYWLIENHMLAHKIADQSIGSRAHRRLKENENYEDLLLLQSCDKLGRSPGVETSTLEEAIEFLREIQSMFH